MNKEVTTILHMMSTVLHLPPHNQLTAFIFIIHFWPPWLPRPSDSDELPRYSGGRPL